MDRLKHRMLFAPDGRLIGDDGEETRFFGDLFPRLDWEEVSARGWSRAYFQVKRADSSRDYRMEIFPTCIGGEKVFMCLLEARGVTSVEGSLKDLQTIVDAMPFGAALIDRDKRVRFMNRAALELAGYGSFAEYRALDVTCQESFCPVPDGGCPIWDLGGRFDHTESPFRLRDGTTIFVERTAVPVMIEGQEMMLEGIIDLRPQKAAERSARTDTLTGLWNRMGLCSHAGEFEAAPGYGVFVIDINDLKIINDRWGHSAGDEAIRFVSEVLRHVVSEDGLAGRWGGDEFVLFEKNCSSPEDAEKRVTQIRRALRERPSWLPVQVGVSVGYSISRFPGERWEAVFDRADEAMYCCKGRSDRDGDHGEEEPSPTRCPCCGAPCRDRQAEPV